MWACDCVSVRVCCYEGCPVCECEWVTVIAWRNVWVTKNDTRSVSVWVRDWACEGVWLSDSACVSEGVMWMWMRDCVWVYVIEWQRVSVWVTVSLKVIKTGSDCMTGQLSGWTCEGKSNWVIEWLTQLLSECVSDYLTYLVSGFKGASTAMAICICVKLNLNIFYLNPVFNKIKLNICNIAHWIEECDLLSSNAVQFEEIPKFRRNIMTLSSEKC